MNVLSVRFSPYHLAAVAVLAIVALFTMQNGASAAEGMTQPQISSQASASGYPAGVSIYDSATLGMGNNPTGTITFRLYGPSDVTCSGSPIFTANTAVNGNGYYQSGYFVTNAAGTYRWTAAYNGDAGNHPTSPTTCDAPSSAVIVSKRMPTLNSTASTPAADGSITNSAVLGMGSGPSGPTGEITFTLFGPNNMTCAGAPVFTSVRTVNGNGRYASNPFTPASPGNYQWKVSYGGDSNNWGARTNCSDPANAVTVSSSSGGGGGGAVAVSVAASPTVVQRAGYLTVTWSGLTSPTSTDWVALAPAGSPNGTVTAWRYTSGTPSGSVSVKVPWGAAPGSYEVRLFANNSLQRLATTNVTVS